MSAEGLAGRSQSMRMYRGYEVKLRKNTWRAKHRIWRMFADLPIEFTWTDTREWDGLRAYIDAWYKGDETLRGLFEGRGLVTEIEFPDPSHLLGEKLTQVNAERFFDCLKLRKHFAAPMWTKARFVTDGDVLVPDRWIQLLIEADPVGFAYLKGRGPWRFAKEKDLDSMGLTVSEVTDGMYSKGLPAKRGQAPPRVLEDRLRLAKVDPVTAARVAATQEEPPAEADEEDGIEEQPQAQQSAAPVTTRERLIRRQQHDDGVIDLITQSVPAEGRPWFIRRVLYRGRCLYAANAWHSQGPWTVWQRDDAALITLEIDI
jgi:hypothetical protein